MIGLAATLAAASFAASAARAVVIEGEGLVAETNVDSPAIGEWVGFLIFFDLSRPEPFDVTTVFYLDRPGNGMLVTTRLGGPFAPVTNEIGCNGVGGAAWNDDPSRGDALSAAGTDCDNYTTGEPVYAALLDLRDGSASALDELAFPDPVVLADFPDRQRLDVVVEEILGEQPRAFSVAIVRIPEAGTTAAGLGVLVAFGAVARGRGQGERASRSRSDAARNRERVRARCSETGR